MKTTFFLALISFCAWAGIRIVSGIQFDRNCGGHLALAANANTVPLATVELQKAVDYATQNDLTHGYTSALWKTPDEDLGFWYANMTEALTELKQIPSDATPLEKSNLLMKLRESIMTSSSGGEALFIPSGISVYPSNLALLLLGFVSGITALVSGCILLSRL